MVGEAVELMEDKTSFHLLEETNESQWNTDASHGDISMEELERLVDKVHLQYGDALRKLAE